MQMKAGIIALLLYVAPQVSAQSILEGKKTEDLSLMLEEVVVTGTGTEHYLKDAPVQTEVITRRALEQFQARSMKELLAGLSPSLTFHDGSMGSHIQLNGLNNDYILILIDGKRMNGYVGGQNDLNLLNPANIERIEIVKGAASSLYGSDAIAGVINIITKKHHDKTEFTSTSRVGAYGDVRESASLGLTIGKVKSMTGMNFHHTDGWRNTDLQWNQQQLKPGSTMKTVNRSTNYTLTESLDWNVNDRLSLTASGSCYERWVVRPHGPWSYLPNDFYYRNYGFAAGGKYRLGGRNYLTADLSYDRYGYFYDYKLQEVTDYFKDGDRITYFPGQRIKQSVQRQILGQVKGVFYIGDRHLLNTGFEYLYNHLESPHHIDGDRASVYTLAAYAQEEWTAADDVVLTAGARGTVHKETGFNLSPKIAVLYNKGDFRLRASYALGYKSPTVKELYYNYTATLGGGSLTAYHGNKDLKAQTSQYASVGAEYAGRKFQASVTAYANFLRNMIELVEINMTAEEKLDEIEKSKMYLNLTQARIWGVDFTFNYQPVQTLTVSGGYSFSDPRAQYPDQGADYMKYIPIDATSQHNATLNASWHHTWSRYRLGLAVYGRYQSVRRYVEDNDADAFQTWRINTAHTLLGMKKWTLTLNVGVDNLFNYVDRTPFGRNRATTTPGRTVYASALIKFKNR
ncbi:TonB-dependent receptor [Mediterranea massiliensis]|uniref:TonB-dependent receptor n=2 Tax=Mediterranea massiliensis TaxID=1841865 RepID=A0ABS2E1J0_9BACT|nr:TonB-dependent receptor [Mediterranea massiliensis]MBM6735505.1 TonB-dependent receptor [Mediterranea massiliensis]